MATEVVARPWLIQASLIVSVAVHALTFAALGWIPPPDDSSHADETVEVSVIESSPELPEPKPAEPEPQIAQEPPPAPKSAPAPKREPPPKVAAAVAPKTPPPDLPAPAAAAEETVADFSGTTLVGDGGWVSAVGSGAPMDSPVGKAGAVVTGRARDGVAGGILGGTGLRVVPLADLSRKPTAPSQNELNDALERSYPKAARQQGIEGLARIKIRVLPTGRLQTLATLSETYPGFGDACRASLRDLRFEPGLDRLGQPVATEVPYVCEFRVE